MCHLEWSPGLFHLGTFHLECVTWNATVGKLHLEYFTCNASPGMHHMECFTWNASPGMFHLDFFTWNISPGMCHMEYFTWNVSPGIFHLECFIWNVSHGIFLLECFTWVLEEEKTFVTLQGPFLRVILGSHTDLWDGDKCASSFPWGSSKGVRCLPFKGGFSHFSLSRAAGSSPGINSLSSSSFCSSVSISFGLGWKVIAWKGLGYPEPQQRSTRSSRNVLIRSSELSFLSGTAHKLPWLRLWVGWFGSAASGPYSEVSGWLLYKQTSFCICFSVVFFVWLGVFLVFFFAVIGVFLGGCICVWFFVRDIFCLVLLFLFWFVVLFVCLIYLGFCFVLYLFLIVAETVSFSKLDSI